MAQLGARFHGMEEVVSSNLTRSTKIPQTLTDTEAAGGARKGVQMESEMDSTEKGRNVLGCAHKNTPQILQTSLSGGKPDKPD